METLKTCYRCNQPKPALEFGRNISKKDGLQSECKLCDKTRKRLDYANRTDAIKNQNRRRKRATRLKNVKSLLEYLENHPCVDCGETDPLVLEFDHLRDKKDNIATMLGSRCWDEVVKEIAKCEVCCSNCHKRRTAKSRGWLKMLLAAPDE